MIAFEDVHARYAPHLPLVLRGVTLSIARGERVSLVGRTGSGKTSTTALLFRFLAVGASSGAVAGLTAQTEAAS